MIDVIAQRTRLECGAGRANSLQVSNAMQSQMSAENFAQLGDKQLRCPVCSLPFAGPLRPALESLGNAIACVKAQEIAAHFQVEFVVYD